VEVRRIIGNAPFAATAATPPRNLFADAHKLSTLPQGEGGKKRTRQKTQCHPDACPGAGREHREPWAARQTQAQPSLPTRPWGAGRKIRRIFRGGGLRYRRMARDRLCAELPRSPRPEICSLTLTNCRPSPKGRVGRNRTIELPSRLRVQFLPCRADLSAVAFGEGGSLWRRRTLHPRPPCATIASCR